jgi:hypothetical protein
VRQVDRPPLELPTTPTSSQFSLPYLNPVHVMWPLFLPSPVVCHTGARYHSLDIHGCNTAAAKKKERKKAAAWLPQQQQARRCPRCHRLGSPGWAGRRGSGCVPELRWSARPGTAGARGPLRGPLAPGRNPHHRQPPPTSANGVGGIPSAAPSGPGRRCGSVGTQQRFSNGVAPQASRRRHVGVAARRPRWRPHLGCGCALL